MLKRILILILALCCAFSFIAQPAAATGAELLFGVLDIGMAIAGAFGLTFASNDGYEAFGNNIHDAVIQTPGPAGSEWWNRSLAGNIVLTGMDQVVKTAVWSCAKQAADALPQTEQDAYTTTITTNSYSVNSAGYPVDLWNFSGKSYTFTSVYSSPIYCVEGVVPTNRNPDDIAGSFCCTFFSSNLFTILYTNGSSENASQFSFNGISFYCLPCNSSYFWHSIDDYRLRKNCILFNSINDVNSYMSSLCAMSSGVSSAGGATAAYPTYGYDNVNLPNIDLTQSQLIAEDGTSMIGSLMDQLKSGAITWEDYIGTVAPGQTATITLTDESGAAVTYTLTNTGVGEKVQTGTDVTEATQPVVVPGTGELTGTLADTDAKSFLDTLAETIAVPFADVIAKVQAIPAAISDVLSQALSAFKPVSELAHFAIDLRKYFPFCVPFDIYDFIMCLNAAPEAPVINWEIPLPGGSTYPMEIDLSPFDPVAQLLRRLQLLLFCVGLAFKTRDLIKG